MTDQDQSRQQSFLNKTAVICGGSLGIGKATAREIVLRGGSVCLVARQPGPLLETACELNDLLQNDSQWVVRIACDCTNYKEMEQAFNGFIEKQGVPDYLLNVVGNTNSQYVQDLTVADFRECMESNFFGQLIPTLILLPNFIAAGEGHIGFVSSMMGYFGIMGYAAYAPAKFAIAGLAETLRHELKPYNITVSVIYPPDTDTPGLEKELQMRPEECSLIAEGAGLTSAEEVAVAFVEGLLKKKYAILPGKAQLAWRVNSYAPWLLRWITDRQYEQARKVLGKA
jgi:3-dehydrosphinganine reductase